MIRAALVLGLLAALATPAAAGPREDVAALHWMAGDWIEERPGVTIKEHWTLEKSGALNGVGETIAAGKPPRVERMKITAEPTGATFTALVEGQPPTPFVRLPGPAGEAVFENKGHDFPQRVIYRRCDASMCARIEGQVQGKLKFQEWRYRRAK